MEHLSTVRFEDIPRDTVYRARLVAADTFGCILSGKHEKAAHAAHAQVMDWGGTEQADHVGVRRTRHLCLHTAYVNAAVRQGKRLRPGRNLCGGPLQAPARQ